MICQLQLEKYILFQLNDVYFPEFIKHRLLIINFACYDT
jgi:hypothetical protein